ncbi:hypothetical protein DES42_10913 [Zavarzinia compransoris]|nr:hypothetical protein DES42_10913 [Zavarzinia compransoris]
MFHFIYQTFASLLGLLLFSRDWPPAQDRF